MAHRSVELKLRVVLVTTRAALRHADSVPERRRELVERGRALVEGVAASATDGADRAAVDRAYAELDELASGG